MLGDLIRPPEQGNERTNLRGVLDYARGAVIRKVAGLTEEQVRCAAAPPSTLTPGGIMKHLIGTERFWFSIDFADLAVDRPWPDHDPESAFVLTDLDTVDELVDAYRAECARSEAAVADFELDDTAKADGMSFTLRFAYAHMIEETARHAGHLDLLREMIDGSTGP